MSVIFVFGGLRQEDVPEFQLGYRRRSFIRHPVTLTLPSLPPKRERDRLELQAQMKLGAILC